MSIKDNIIELINVLYRKDPFVNDFSMALSQNIERIISFCESVRNNYFFDRLDEDGAKWWENLLKITPLSTQTLEDRQAKIQAKYISSGHNEILLIQKACDSWKNGEVEADFVNGKIQIQFIGMYGIPSDLDSLKESIEEIKPAYIPLEWKYKYLLKKDIHNVLTKTKMEAYKKHQYCDVGIGENKNA